MKKIVIALLLVVGALVLVRLLARREVEPRLIGGDKDEGGCLIGAGYSWCEAKHKCLRVWEEPCE